MALVTTPGASTADSFASFAEYGAYCTARGRTASVEATAEIELRKAAGYLENQYRGRWIGVRTNADQALSWPRADGDRSQWRTTLLYPLLDIDGCEIDTDAIPTQLKHAQIELALLIKAGVTLEPRLERGGQIKSIGKGLGPLRKDITYMDGAPAVDRFTVVEGLLRGLVTSTPGSSSGSIRLVRG